MNQLELFAQARKRTRPSGAPVEWKIVSLRELATPGVLSCDRPEVAADYWRQNIATAPHFNSDCECFAVLLLNTRMRVRGHHIISIGSLNETIAFPREVFRAAVIGAAWGVVLMHNHPSGDPSPSTADITITKTLVEAGVTLRIKVLDHVIVGGSQHASFRAMGLI